MNCMPAAGLKKSKTVKLFKKKLYAYLLKLLQSNLY